jgi:hypothetical protein
VELLLKAHEASRQAILELFKFTQNEVEQIITRIQQQVKVPDRTCAAFDGIVCPYLYCSCASLTCKQGRSSLMLKDKDPVLDAGATLVISWAGHKGPVFKA